MADENGGGGSGAAAAPASESASAFKEDEDEVCGNKRSFFSVCLVLYFHVRARVCGMNAGGTGTRGC